ncbi:alkaline phosphatase PhoX [Nostoc favosum]|uniref:PhoX family protein n=1 Tax=Nostoc favosum CHAB5714 TaxID=2780399 RepID=A0ABS8IJL6_9NOSO|nr:alkaline phosphatase PhoX [Nostoc favosum]MCC5604374.1 PhoX family protein [Nostoc favosum CHAB5714]
MNLSRRQFFTLAGASATGAVLLSPLQAFYAKPAIAAGPYGNLVTDPNGVLDLPAGFTYRRLSETGQTMNDGYLVPGGHDGMGAFAGSNGDTILIRNHELGTSGNGVGAPNGSKYNSNARGGCTKLVVNSSRNLVEHRGVLAGTIRNCAGGPTPSGSWLTCEETFENNNGKKHGYVFEVPSSANTFVTPVPLTAMGRFNHEAAAVDPNTGYIYMTEDRGDGLFYRFIPNQSNNLSAGGSLYALRITGSSGINTATGFPKNTSRAVNWVQISNPDPTSDTVRTAGYNSGAARFSGGEGIFYGSGYVYFTCKSGGSSGDGQIWRYSPANNTVELYIEPNNSGVLDNPDNIIVFPNRDIFLCEDGDGTDYILGITSSGGLYKFAKNALNTSEFAGVCFSPDGQTMFVNMQSPGITFAIWPTTASW